MKNFLRYFAYSDVDKINIQTFKVWVRHLIQQFILKFLLQHVYIIILNFLHSDFIGEISGVIISKGAIRP